MTVPLPSEETKTSHHSQPAPRRIVPKPLTILVVLVGVLGILCESSILKNINLQTSTTTVVSQCHNETVYIRHDRNNTGFVYHDKIFGHVHIAKTAGTDINGQLAVKYERICGHKGYSYDAIQFNKRMEKKAAARPGQTLRLDDGAPDIISKQVNKFNRGRVPLFVTREIGYEDCDYISLENSWQEWVDIAKIWPLELHVPCRDPIEHLMSKCNFRYHRFNCNATNLAQEIHRCAVHEDRFHAKLTQSDNITLKCFPAAPVEPYLEYMDQYLQRRRIQTNYIHRSTNKQRKKEKECLWNNQELIASVLKILLSQDYYRWCNGCMGSNDDLSRQF